MAKSKRSKRMRANRRALREKLVKKDEAKRLAAIKNNLLNPQTVSVIEIPNNTEEMQVSETTNMKSEFNTRTLKNKDGHYPSWLSGRQRKRLQIKETAQKKHLKKKQPKVTKKGRFLKRKDQENGVSSDKAEAMLLA